MNQQHLSVAVEAAKAGATELMSRRHDRVVREKGPKDLVTDADLASQQAIRRVLLEAFDQYVFVGEEEGEHDPPEAVRRGDADAPHVGSWIRWTVPSTMSIDCSRSRFRLVSMLTEKCGWVSSMILSRMNSLPRLMVRALGAMTN